MPGEDVKIHVAADADLKGIEETQRKIAELRRAATAYEAKGIDTAAATARADANALERDLNKTLRARAADERAVAKERLNAGREVQAAAERWTAKEKEAAKEKADAEKQATRELKEQEAMRRAGIRQQDRMVGAGLRIGVGAVGGEIAADIIEQLAAGQTLANRRAATEARNQRQYTILNSIRGSSGQVAGEAWQAEENVAQLRRDRPQLQTEQKFGAARAVVEGIGWGGGLGAALGSVVPGIGTLLGFGIGSVLGAGVRGIPAYLQGRNRIQQSEQDQQQEEARGQQLSELAPKLFLQQEGGLQLEALRSRSRRTLEGQRTAFVDEMAEQWLNTYRDIYNRTKGNDAMSKEMADLTVGNLLRDRQVQAGAGLVDSRSGGAEIAAAARWATGAVPGQADVAAKIDQLHTTVQAGNQAIQLINQAK